MTKTKPVRRRYLAYLHINKARLRDIMSRDVETAENLQKKFAATVIAAEELLEVTPGLYTPEELVAINAVLLSPVVEEVCKRPDLYSPLTVQAALQRKRHYERNIEAIRQLTKGD